MGNVCMWFSGARRRDRSIDRGGMPAAGDDVSNTKFVLSATCRPGSLGSLYAVRTSRVSAACSARSIRGRKHHHTRAGRAAREQSPWTRPDPLWPLNAPSDFYAVINSVRPTFLCSRGAISTQFAAGRVRLASAKKFQHRPSKSCAKNGTYAHSGCIS